MARNKPQKVLKHQRAVARSTAKHVARRREGLLAAGGRGDRALVRASGAWPLHEVLLTRDWRTRGQLVQILVARRGPAGQIAVGVFLMDLACLGIKSAFASLRESREEYENILRSQMMSRQPMVKADLNLVAKIIEEGYYYALDLGFQPDPDYRDALLVVGEADPDAWAEEIPLGGDDGKPFFFAGPYDNAQGVIAKLTRKLGPDGFTYMVRVDGDDEVFFDKEEE